MEVKKLTAGIKALAKNGAARNATIQTLGLACLEQAAEHKNPTYLCDLYNALNKGEKDGFGKWALNFGNLKPNRKQDTKARLPFIVDHDKAADIPGAVAMVWTEFQPEPKAVERLQDENKAVESLMNRLLEGKGFKNPEKAKALGTLLDAAIKAAA